MTVGELVAELGNVDPETPVWLEVEGDGAVYGERLGAVKHEPDGVWLYGTD